MSGRAKAEIITKPEVKDNQEGNLGEGTNGVLQLRGSGNLVLSLGFPELSVVIKRVDCIEGARGRAVPRSAGRAPQDDTGWKAAGCAKGWRALVGSVPRIRGKRPVRLGL